MTRRPERIGGVWVATLTPATRISARLRQPHQSRGTGDAERGEERLVAVEHVPARVETEHLELGAHLLGDRHLRQPADRRLVGCVAEVERELHVDRSHGSGGLRLRRRADSRTSRRLVRR